MNYLCVDFGGTKTLIAIIDENGEKTHREKFETPGEYIEFLDTLSAKLTQLPEKFTRGVMAAPGLLDRKNGVVLGLGNRPWSNFHIVSDIKERTGIDLIIENDAKLAGLAEALHLKDKYKSVLYLTVSTGIGGALVVDGKLVEALLDTEVGMMPLNHQGATVVWEEFASGRAISEKYHRFVSDIAPEEEDLWKEIAHNLVEGIGPLCAAFQPDAIVFGGGAGKQSDKFSDRITNELKQILHPVVKQPKALLSCYYGDDSVIYGCYELAKANHAKATD